MHQNNTFSQQSDEQTIRHFLESHNCFQVSVDEVTSVFLYIILGNKATGRGLFKGLNVNKMVV